MLLAAPGSTQRALPCPDEAREVAHPVPPGADRQVLGPAGADGRGDGGPVSRRGVRIAAAQPAVGGPDVPLPSGFGIDQHHRAHIGQRELTRIHHLDGDDIVAGGQMAQWPLPVERRLVVAGRIDEVGHDDPKSWPITTPSERVDGGGQAGARAVAIAEAGHHAAGPVCGHARPIRAVPSQPVGAECDHTEPVAWRVGQQADRPHDLGCHITFLGVDRAERHAWCDVEQHPRVEPVVSARSPYVHVGRAGGDVPVDPADVVAGLVPHHFFALTANAKSHTFVITGHQAVDPAPDAEVECAKRMRSHEATSSRS